MWPPSFDRCRTQTLARACRSVNGSLQHNCLLMHTCTFPKSAGHLSCCWRFTCHLFASRIPYPTCSFHGKSTHLWASSLLLLHPRSAYLLCILRSVPPSASVAIGLRLLLAHAAMIRPCSAHLRWRPHARISRRIHIASTSHPRRIAPHYMASTSHELCSLPVATCAFFFFALRPVPHCTPTRPRTPTPIVLATRPVVPCMDNVRSPAHVPVRAGSFISLPNSSIQV